jgi:hypothetical protein
MYTFRKEKYPLAINFGDAYSLLPKYGIHVLSLLVDDNIAKTLTTILTDDLKVMGLWWEFMKDHVSGTFEENLSDLTPEDFTSFKEALWTAIINFTNPRLRPALVKGREEVERELTKALKNMKFSERSSDTVEEPE